MGLDQYVYLMRKATPEQLQAVIDQYENKPNDTDLSNVNVTELTDDAKRLMATVRDYYDVVTMPTAVFQESLLRKAFDVPEDYVYGESRMSPYLYETNFYPPDDKGRPCRDETSIHIEINPDEMDTTYAIVETLPYAVFVQEEVCSWRGYWDMQNFLSDTLPVEAENCGIYKLDDNVLRQMMSFDSEFRPPMTRKGECLTYHPWW